MKEQIEALQNTYTHLLDAHTTYRKFMSLTKRPDVGGVLNQIAGIAQIVTAQCQVICAERDRQNDRIYGKGILRVRINGGDHSHEITVQRPDNTCDNPHINEVAYNALKFKLGTAELSSTADFDIDVMSWVQRDIYAESKGFSRRERKGHKAHAAQSTCLRSLTR